MKKRLLLLGGTNCAEEIQHYAKKHDIELIATGIYPDTILKRISSESYDVDAANIKLLSQFIREKKIDAIFTGCNEFIVPKAIAVSIENNLPHYCELQQWEICMNKEKFKDLCQRFGIPVAKKYDIAEIDKIQFPVVVKPSDSCGSQGFSICNSVEDIHCAIDFAKKHSRTSSYLIEEYMPYDACIIHYTAIDGELYFSGMSDKKSGKLNEKNSSVMSLQIFPSINKNDFLEKYDAQVKKMFSSININNGPIWIEAFNNGGDIYFNEMGFRFGGSMTFHPVNYFYGISQLDLLLDYSIYGKNEPVNWKEKNTTRKYCILPLHVKAGTIDKIIGESYIASLKDMYKYIPIHCKGDTISNDGTVQQVFCYLHILFDDKKSLIETLEDIMSHLKVLDQNGNNLLFCLYDGGLYEQ